MQAKMETTEHLDVSSIRKRLLLTLFVGLLVVSAAFVATAYFTFRNYVVDTSARYGQGITSLIAAEIDGDDVDEYLSRGHDFPTYDAIEQRLYALSRAYPDILYLYVYQIQPDGCHVVFDLDIGTDTISAEEPGAIVDFDESFAPFIDDLLAGKPVDPIVTDDTFGHLLTVYRPIYDSQGTCQCYAAVDFSMDAINDLTRNILLSMVIVLVAFVGIVAIIGFGITEHRVMRPMEQIERTSYTDPLTGLKNKTSYLEYATTLDARIASGTAEFAILMIDANFLKRVNDTYGHEKGDAYLKACAELVRCVFGTQHSYRVGGDEFLAVLEEKETLDAGLMLQKFKSVVQECQDNPVLEEWEKVSAAIGMATFTAKEDSCADDVLKRADAAMYANKVAMKAHRTE